MRLPETLTDVEGSPGGWLIDTPGIRSFGLAHVDAETVLQVFDDLNEITEDCPRGCSHIGPPADPECALDELDAEDPDLTATRNRRDAVRRLLTALRSNVDWES